MVSLVHDPSVWTTDVNVVPSMSDLFFVVWRHLPIVSILLLSLSPFILPGLMSSKVAVVQLASYLAEVDYRLIVEFVLDFVNVMPGTPKSKVKSRIILTPQHAKRLMKAMIDNVQKFEIANGTIKDIEEIQLPMQFGGPTAQA
jgi:hypothetical protein